MRATNVYLRARGNYETSLVADEFHLTKTSGRQSCRAINRVILRNRADRLVSIRSNDASDHRPSQLQDGAARQAIRAFSPLPDYILLRIAALWVPEGFV